MAICPHCQTINTAADRYCQHCSAELNELNATSLAPGSVMNQRYQITRVIASGGMSIIYEARAMNLGDLRCVVKALDDQRLPKRDREGAVYQFKREAAILAHLDHPGLPRVFDHFEEQDGYYLVMEYVPGNTLEELLEQNDGRPFPLSQVVQWIVELCAVVDYLHSQSPPIIFRDLKPGNVMITTQDQVKLIDFGIARTFVPGQSRDTQLYGTQGYSAPEQYGNGQTDARSDVYSLGVILHELLTGHNPSTTPIQLPSPRRYNIRLSEGVIRVIEKATRPNPKLRYQTVFDLRSALLATQPRDWQEKQFGDQKRGSYKTPMEAVDRKTVPLSASQPTPRSRKQGSSVWFWPACILVILMLCACCSLSVWAMVETTQSLNLNGQHVWAS